MIGLGSYAYFWQQSGRVDEPLSLIDVLHDTRAQDVGLFQICDYTPLMTMSAAEIADAASVARDLGIEIELGTKGIVPDHLETYEQVPTDDLIALIERIGSDRLGICLDPANVVARLETPRCVVERCAPLTKNVHVKDFAFARQDGWVGFTYSGAAMGTGLHDYPHLLTTIRPREREINEIVEHWLPWQGDAETTIRTEREWTRITLEHLRSTS